MVVQRTTNSAMFRGLHGCARRSALQLHRMVEFDAAWDSFISGKCTAAFVTYRARKMLESGLPKLR